MIVFIKKNSFPVALDTLFSWHERPGALLRLSPPWDPLELIEHTGGIRDNAKVVFRMHAGPVPITWEARHFDYKKNELFRDIQVRGPFRHWIHTHRFHADGSVSSILEDEIECALPFSFLTHRLGKPWVTKRLERIFHFRHHTLAQDFAMQQRYPARSLRIAISGGSGLVGSTLIPFLTTSGHEVVRLVRRPPRSDSPIHEIQWDPYQRHLDPASLENLDAVIHLCGENIGKGRWTPEKKRRILESRTIPTEFLARTLARLSQPPSVFLSASAIGYYGNRGATMLTEADGPGADFISQVCTAWEKSAEPAKEKGIRVALLRIGVVLTPLGGALREMLPAFRLGLGGPIAAGNQFISWVHMDDLLGSIYHILFTPELSGPINITAPYAVAQRDFADQLGKVLARPIRIRVPAAMIKALFGKKGEEILLASTRVFPYKLLASHYVFRYPQLEPALRHLLGRMQKPRG